MERGDDHDLLNDPHFLDDLNEEEKQAFLEKSRPAVNYYKSIGTPDVEPTEQDLEYEETAFKLRDRPIVVGRGNQARRGMGSGRGSGVRQGRGTWRDRGGRGRGRVPGQDPQPRNDYWIV